MRAKIELSQKPLSEGEDKSYTVKRMVNCVPYNIGDTLNYEQVSDICRDSRFTVAIEGIHGQLMLSEE